MLYTFTGITTIHIYTRTHDTLLATAFMAHLAERHTRFVRSWIWFSPNAFESLENLHTRNISLSFTIKELRIFKKALHNMGTFFSLYDLDYM